MPTYYEILNIQPTAAITEIQTAYEQQYNRWRRLVTHHDPSVVNQANQALQALETIRATLTDPSKRSAYDAGVGLGNVGGLADPEAVLRMSPPRPTPPPPKTSSAPVAGAPSLWTCPKCGTDNPEHTQYCFKCATQLVRTCPGCGNMSSLISTGICGKCGAKYETVMKRIELTKQRTALISNRTNLEQNIGSLYTQAIEANRRDYGGIVVPTLIGLGALVASCFLGVLTLFEFSPGNPPWAGLLVCGSLSLAAGAIGILFIVGGIWSFRNAEIKRVNLLNDLSMEIEFKQQQIAQVDAQRAGLDRAIQELG